MHLARATIAQSTKRDAWVFYKDPSLLVPAASFLIAFLVVITVVSVWESRVLMASLRRTA